jgi:pyridoxamine 5'-phosphate oxidase
MMLFYANKFAEFCKRIFIMIKIADIRTEYKLRSLNEKDVNANPVVQFTKWWDEAVQSEIDDVNAATLATATLNGKPSARIILLKGYDERGFVFFTNYESNKGREIAANPQVSLVFFWKELQRQIRIEGTVEKVNTKESDEYFSSRPTGSRIGAWASPQSHVIKDRSEIEENAKKYKQQYPDENIPRPPYWGGYRIKPELIEFWQGRPSRLHDRIQYSLQKNNTWKIERLAP